jgi:4-diphosphocytidyl-2-C-methyl-D-erythritol kinase
VTARRGLDAPRRFLGLPAPAKLNLFLHVLGRRADGYHDIESVFVPIDLCDTLDLTLRADGRIVREGDLTGPESADLAVRAARALQEHAAAGAAAAIPGVTIGVRKCIPVGAGLGGGSSDAATTLIGLNRLWDLGLPRAALVRLARGLGADVPFFLGGGSAFVEGTGEQCTPLPPWRAWYVVVYPQVHVSTAEIFGDPKLTRDSKRTTIAGFSASLQALADEAVPQLFGTNDLEPVARRRFPAVDAALRLLEECAAPEAQPSLVRMSGSGSAVFCPAPDAAAASAVLARVRARMPQGWSAWAPGALAELPLAQW